MNTSIKEQVMASLKLKLKYLQQIAVLDSQLDKAIAEHQPAKKERSALTEAALSILLSQEGKELSSAELVAKLKERGFKRANLKSAGMALIPLCQDGSVTRRKEHTCLTTTTYYSASTSTGAPFMKQLESLVVEIARIKGLKTLTIEAVNLDGGRFEEVIKIDGSQLTVF